LSWKHRIVDTTNLILSPFNAAIAKKDSLPSWGHLFRMANQLNFIPVTVFDIGVAYGTPWLYEAFPDAFYYLIDPLRESLPHMKAISKSLRTEILNVALGDRSGEIEIEVHENIGGSTIFIQEGLADTARTTSYPVPVRRLDELVKAFESPALCKIDVQGAELGVLRGMEGILPLLDLVIVECQNIPTLQGTPEAVQVIAFMDAHNFGIYDILSLSRRPLDGATAQMDIAFAGRNSVFFKDKRWS
jgi:FkbM family methyltransferase